MPKEFNNLGVRFLYPDNWELQVEADAAECRAVTVFSPGSGFWSVTIHPRAANPLDLAKAGLKAMEEEYDELDKEAVSEVVGDCALVGFDMNFFSLDLTATARIRSLRSDEASYTVFCQAEDREFAYLAPVFRAITTSLVHGLATPDLPI